MRKINLLLLAFIIISSQLTAQDFSGVTISETKVTDNIYYLKGAGGNIGLYKWDEGNLIVDSQFQPLGDKIKDKISSLTGGSTTKYLIDTHYHGDHLGGNSNFSKEGVTIVAQENVRTRIQKTFYNTTLKSDVKDLPKEYWPTVTFKENLSLFAGEEEIRIVFTPNAHTDGDAVIKFVNSNVIHGGDVYVRYGYPFIDTSAGGSIGGIIAGLDTIISLSDADTKIIPGHGELANVNDVIDLRDVLLDASVIIKTLKNQGKSLDEVLTLKPLSKYDEKYSGSFINSQTFIQLVFNSL